MTVKELIDMLKKLPNQDAKVGYWQLSSQRGPRFKEYGEVIYDATTDKVGIYIS